MNLTRRALLTAAFALPLVAAFTPLTWMGQTLASQGSNGEGEAAPLEQRPLVIHSAQGPHRLSVEMAQTQAQRQKGLMGREVLPADHGMLFTYAREQSPHNGFWMYRTLIALDIAFIDSDGTIVAIMTMPPCESASPSNCRAYAPGTPYHAALEVNAGYFEQRGISVGDCVSLSGNAGACGSP
ncbi:DUF192 domain-containing protein [Halomonas vilamensis]|uniref:DUF192 domain-containing protein n=1 Tax=Vreelandella vilamensis TaxID=531309 RepID=A0ABU1H1X3_9GAMM|nr:DUF192 domain-containing protein [Halomonas vilamensis]MDR5897523.1 DUF192 domain-containing protein [Halomonas vilamensis]